MADSTDQLVRTLQAKVFELETKVAALLAAAVSHGWTV